jgi:hypothetical protein
MSTTIFNNVAEKQRKKTAFWAVFLVSERCEYSLKRKAAQNPAYGAVGFQFLIAFSKSLNASSSSEVLLICTVLPWFSAPDIVTVL